MCALFLVAVGGLLIAVTSLVAENLGLGLTDSVVAVHGLRCPRVYGTFCVGRQILNHWTIWGVLHIFF